MIDIQRAAILVRRLCCPGMESASCLFWAGAAVQLLREAGYDACFQAGTAMFQRLPNDEDDGVVLTHFSYVWDEKSALLRAECNLLPEMHVWAAVPSQQILVDLTTPYLPEQCRKLANLEWRMPVPEPLIAAVDRLPAGWVYDPNPTATILAARLYRKVVASNLLSP